MPFGIILVGIVGGAIAKYIGGDTLREDVIETGNRAVIPDNIEQLIADRSKPESLRAYDPILMEEKVLSLDNPNTVVIYIYTDGSFRYGYCFERVDLFRFLRRVVKDLNESEETSEVKCIWKKYKEDKDTLAGHGCRPTDQYIANGINFVYKYFMLIDFIPLLLNNPNEREFYAIPVENGKPRRIGNVYGYYAVSGDHGQIPGSTVYELFSATDLNPKEITLFRGLYSNDINNNIKNEFTKFYKQFYSRSKGLFRTESDASGLTIETRRRSLQRQRSQQSSRRDSLGSLNGDSDDDYDPDNELAAQRDYDNFMAERYYDNYGDDNVSYSDEESVYNDQDIQSQVGDNLSQNSENTRITYNTDMGIQYPQIWFGRLTLERYQNSRGKFRIGQFLIDASGSYNFEEYESLFHEALKRGIRASNYENVIKVVLSTCNTEIFDWVTQFMLQDHSSQADQSDVLDITEEELNICILNNMCHIFDRFQLMYVENEDYKKTIDQISGIIRRIQESPFYNYSKIVECRGKKNAKFMLHHFIKRTNRSIGTVEVQDQNGRDGYDILDENFYQFLKQLNEMLTPITVDGFRIDLYHIQDEHGHKPIYYLYNFELSNTLKEMLKNGFTEVTLDDGFADAPTTIRTRTYQPQDFNAVLFHLEQREYYGNIPDIINEYLGR